LIIARPLRHRLPRKGDRPWTYARTVRYLNLQQFQDAWKEEFDGWKFDFAVALDYFEFVHRPSKVADWLTTRREVVIDYFNFPSLYRTSRTTYEKCLRPSARRTFWPLVRTTAATPNKPQGN
jgi:hypothetical protein